jgi:4-hydroxybenzoate polyprenyltransferase
VVLQILYNLLFKHVLILDIMTLATGFVLRAVAGAATARVDLSPWFLFCVALLAFYIVLEKRKGELRRKDDSGITTRRILDSYSIPYLRQVETAVLAALLVGYALWTIQGAETAWMMLTVPFVLYGILRYQLLSEKEIVERPEDILFRDRPLLLNVFLWLISCFLILAFQRFGF